MGSQLRVQDEPQQGLQHAAGPPGTETGLPEVPYQDSKLIQGPGRLPEGESKVQPISCPKIATEV